MLDGCFIHRCVAELGNYTRSDAADINSALASLYFDLGDYDRAAPIYEQVLDYYSRSDMPLATAMALVNLGACRYRAGHLEEAVGLYRRASSVIDLQLYPELSLTIGSNTGSALAAWATSRVRQGNFRGCSDGCAMSWLRFCVYDGGRASGVLGCEELYI